jgi:hypothetical protein
MFARPGFLNDTRFEPVRISNIGNLPLQSEPSLWRNTLRATALRAVQFFANAICLAKCRAEARRVFRRIRSAIEIL